MAFAYPLVGIPVDVKVVEGSPYHVVGEKYINAVAHGSGCFPVLIPAFGEGKQLESFYKRFTLEKLLSGLDGVFLPGSVSNINPSYFQQALETTGLPSDSQRDETTLAMVNLALEMHVPLFAICRGFQEMNVALGGSLHQKVQEVEGFMDHREDATKSKEEQYKHAHNINIHQGGLLHSLYGKTEAPVNSLHGQGINKLGNGLVIDATAPDNIVEAFSVANAKSFALGVQWHPEWQFQNDDLSLAMYKGFGEAVQARHKARS